MSYSLSLFQVNPSFTLSLSPLQSFPNQTCEYHVCASASWLTRHHRWAQTTHYLCKHCHRFGSPAVHCHSRCVSVGLCCCLLSVSQNCCCGRGVYSASQRRGSITHPCVVETERERASEWEAAVRFQSVKSPRWFTQLCVGDKLGSWLLLCRISIQLLEARVVSHPTEAKHEVWPNCNLFLYPSTVAVASSSPFFFNNNYSSFAIFINMFLWYINGIICMCL